MGSDEQRAIDRTPGRPPMDREGFTDAFRGFSARAAHILTIFRRSAGGAWLLSRDANLLTAEETPE